MVQYSEDAMREQQNIERDKFLSSLSMSSPKTCWDCGKKLKDDEDEFCNKCVSEEESDNG